MTTEDLRFPGSTGAELSGVLHLPAGAAHGSILLAHCFTCSKDVVTMTRLARGLAAAGWAVLRFDFTGLGESDGDFGSTTVAHGVGDVTAAVAALTSRVAGPTVLIGHSLGGAAALLAAPQLDTVTGVVTIGAPASPGRLVRLRPDPTTFAADGTTQVTIAGRDFRVQRRFLADIDAHDQQGAVAELGRPLLVLHAVDDEVVPITEGERIFAAARQPKAFVPILAADHLLRPRTASDHAVALVRTWLSAVH